MEQNIETKKEPQTVSTEEKVIVSTEDAVAKIAALESEKARLISDNANYKLALMKKGEKGDLQESDEERLRRIFREETTIDRISQIDKEKDELYQKALVENKELKTTLLNKKSTLESTTVHTEGEKVKDTLVTPEQLKAFKSMGWSDEKIERYKKNLVRHAR